VFIFRRLKSAAPWVIQTLQSFTWRVTDVTDESMVMYVDFANLYWPGHSTGEKINDNPGGISGDPFTASSRGTLTGLR
jgi:hypothetical protein